MNDPRIDQAKGDVKTVAGKVTGDKDLELQGRTESATAGLRKQADDMMDQAGRTAQDVADRTAEASRDVADKTRDAAKDMADKASDFARDTGDKVGDALDR
jgi:uncharacterized protein YjbJ (UPF0337 family)